MPSSPRVRSSPLTHKLVINQWLLSLFGVDKFDDLAKYLQDSELEGLDESQIHRFHHVIASHFPNLELLPPEILLQYDQNIVQHTNRINRERITRGLNPVTWKYFQYLGLLFCEIYLDRYFQDSENLLEQLNSKLDTCNESLREEDRITPFSLDDKPRSQLNKLAFWMATGSGKTLLMHINIFQFLYYLNKHGKAHQINRILLLTPNEGLSRQHLTEFHQSGIRAALFTKNSLRLSLNQTVEILEITRLRDETGDRTIAVDTFEGKNLVLVDEGHRGASSGEEGSWMRFRSAICEEGFSFEYSATFSQAIAGNDQLTNTYAKSILYDYSYRYFYKDGFGKDYQVFNIERNIQENESELYLVACLLAFFQQLHLYRTQYRVFNLFNIEQPLWVFIGGRVVKGWSKPDASDIVEILLFLNRYVSDRSSSVTRINRILETGIIGNDGSNLLRGGYSYLTELGLTSSQIFDESLAMIFNANSGGQLYIERLLGSDGEIALRLGAHNPPFGVINIGDPHKLANLCAQHEFRVEDRQFTSSLFDHINKENSTINLLIGSRKFTEGWNSWRVSTMGLMNVGKREGAQIIQLFGRGVRLKGYNTSLKRTSAGLPNGVEIPKYIRVLETLSIFGVRANYMAQFRDFLEEEGLLPDNGRIEFVLPVVRSFNSHNLKTIRLRDAVSNTQPGESDSFQPLGPSLDLTPDGLRNNPLLHHPLLKPIVVNWYSRIQSIRSGGIGHRNSITPLDESQLKEQHLSYLDFNELYFELERFKTERKWHNINLTADGIKTLLSQPNWYRIQIPKEELFFDSFEKVQIWHDIALTLLKKFMDRYYSHAKSEWEAPRLEYRILQNDDTNFLDEYRVTIDRTEEDISSKLIELRTHIQNGDIQPWKYRGMHAIQFSQHLYQPLLYFERDSVDVSPIPLNRGERKFVEDLESFYYENRKFFRNKELYMIRNRSRGHGIGFFEAGNFYPDFIVWVVEGEFQRIIFVDPKGIRFLGFNDPKIMFYKTIKDIENRMSDQTVVLDSYIVSNTPSSEMEALWGVNKAEMTRRHILFQDEDRESYIRNMLST